jgi:hypothetical protein
MKINNKVVKHAFIIAYIWKDNNVVYFILTCYQRREISIFQRKIFQLYQQLTLIV